MNSCENFFQINDPQKWSSTSTLIKKWIFSHVAALLEHCYSSVNLVSVEIWQLSIMKLSRLLFVFTLCPLHYYGKENETVEWPKANNEGALFQELVFALGDGPMQIAHG